MVKTDWTEKMDNASGTKMTNYKLAVAYIVFLICYFVPFLLYSDYSFPERGTLKFAFLPLVSALLPISTIWFYLVGWILVIVEIVKIVKAKGNLAGAKHIPISFCIIGACYALVIIATENGYYLSV